MMHKLRILLIAIALPVVAWAASGGIPNISAAKVTSGTLQDARLSSNVPLKNANLNDFTGVASGAAFPVRFISTSPGFLVEESDAASGSRVSRSFTSAGTLVRDLCDDSASSCSQWLSVARSGTTATAINLQATAVQTNGVSITASTGSFTATYTGFSGSVTATWRYAVIGNMACLRWTSTTGTSNATTFTVTGLPAAIRPSSFAAYTNADMQDSAGLHIGRMSVGTDGTVTMERNFSSTGWTASGTKGMASPGSYCYALNW